MRGSNPRRAAARYLPMDFLLLAGFGTLVAHELAYVPTSFSRAPVSHGHLPLLWAIVSPLALLAVGLYIVRSLRSRPGRHSVDVRHLGLAMTGIFLALEILERAVNGLSLTAFATEGVMWAGLAVIPLVATALSRFVSTAVEALVSWITVPQQLRYALVPIAVGNSDLPKQDLSKVLRYSQNRRGPPVRIVH